MFTFREPCANCTRIWHDATSWKSRCRRDEKRLFRDHIRRFSPRESRDSEMIDDKRRVNNEWITGFPQRWSKRKGRRNKKIPQPPALLPSDFDFT